MITLAMDTSNPVGSVALARDGELLGANTFREPATHLVALGQAVEQLLETAKLSPAAIDRIAVVMGPGSFTGLRIGLSFAKGLHAARRIPLLPIDALRLLALPWLAEGARVCAMIDARRGEVYAAAYESASDEDQTTDPGAAHEIMAPSAHTPLGVLDALSAAHAVPDVFVGTGAFAHRDTIRTRFPSAVIIEGDAMFPSTAHLARIAHRMRPLDDEAVRGLEPTYVRASGAEQIRLRGHARRTEPGDE